MFNVQVADNDLLNNCSQLFAHYIPAISIRNECPSPAIKLATTQVREDEEETYPSINVDMLNEWL
jgi:hypothetical protein